MQRRWSYMRNAEEDGATQSFTATYAVNAASIRRTIGGEYGTLAPATPIRGVYTSTSMSAVNGLTPQAFLALARTKYRPGGAATTSGVTPTATGPIAVCAGA